jgi:hypothetical protein
MLYSWTAASDGTRVCTVHDADLLSWSIYACIYYGAAGAADESEASSAASAALQEMDSTLYQLLNSTLWYYLFVQVEGLDWSQPFLTLHSGLLEAQVFTAAEVAGISDNLLKELATYLHQYVGMCKERRFSKCDSVAWKQCCATKPSMSFPAIYVLSC